jgi:dephospho-CoA kinase
MLHIGLTGGIASGKSTVASMLRDRDCLVLEADSLGHELLEPEQASYDEVVRVFGKEILDADGMVDRGKLGAIVFSDPRRRALLDGILHPRILEIVRQWFAMLERPGGPELAVVEAALIIEAGYHKELDRVIVCWCRHDQQVERLVERGLSVDEAEQRIAAQWPIDQKRRMADEVIDCSGAIEATERQVGSVFEKVKQLAASHRSLG